MNSKSSHTRHPQVKICGLTAVDTAFQCAELGANAIGCNFYPKSPRYISKALARDIAAALPPSVQSVGVFVNNTYDEIMETADYCGLTAVQLHGQESPETAHQLLQKGIKVYKVLFIEKEPGLEKADQFDVSGFLVEYGKGPLPGGNAEEWDWGQIRDFGKKYPLILAGGLSLENVHQAIEVSQPDAVDVSSGVESAPGIKDLDKIADFIAAVSESQFKTKKPRTVF